LTRLRHPSSPRLPCQYLGSPGASSTMGDPSPKRAKTSVPEGLGPDHDAVVLRFRPAGSTAAPKVLEYFTLQALGECARLLLEATETPYDSVMHFSASAMKAYAPFGQLPLYHGEEMLGSVLSESGAICRHIARVTHTAGASVPEQALVDQLFELSKDLMGKKAALHEDKPLDAAAGLGMFLAVAEKRAPPAGDGHWVGDGLTLADVSMFHVLQHFLDIKPGSLDAHPKLAAFTAAFAKRPAIAAYLNSDRRVPLTQNETGKQPWAPDGYKYLTPLAPSVCAELWKRA